MCDGFRQLFRETQCFFLKQPNMQASKLLIEEIVQTYLWTALNIF